MMNNNGSTIRKFNRFELKYLISLEQAEQFRTDLQRYLVPDEHGHNNELIPFWLTDMVAAHNLPRVGCSKYCRSIDAAWRLPGTRRHSLGVERSWDVLASSLSTFSTLEQRMGIGRERDKDSVEAPHGHFQHH